MSLKISNRRNVERRVDKITMNARLTAGALRRTAGQNEAKRYLERNEYSEEVIREILQSTTERRMARRRSDSRPARFQSAEHSGMVSTVNNVFEPLTGKEIQLLFRLRWVTDSGATNIRVTDYPARFAHFGLMELNANGVRITEWGRKELLHWTRARELLAISLGQGMEVYDEHVQIWLKDNRFILVTSDGVVATPRGREWLATHKKMLEGLACATP